VSIDTTLAMRLRFLARVIRNLEEFKQISDVIVANRLTDEIRDTERKGRFQAPSAKSAA